MRQVGIGIGTGVSYRIARTKNDEEETCDEKETGDEEETTCDEEKTHGHRAYEVRRTFGFGRLDAQNAYKLAAIVPICTTAATTAALSDDPRHRVLRSQIHLIPFFPQFFYDSQLPTTVVRLTTMKICLLATTS